MDTEVVTLILGATLKLKREGTSNVMETEDEKHRRSQPALGFADIELQLIVVATCNQTLNQTSVKKNRLLLKTACFVMEIIQFTVI